MTPGELALEALRLLSSAFPLEDLVYEVRDSERGSGKWEGDSWHGPRVTAWADGCESAAEALEAAGIKPEELWRDE